MPYTQVHRGLGSFTVPLKRGHGTGGATPHTVLEQITPFSAVVVTPTYLGAAGTLDSATLLGKASFSGIVQARGDNRCTLEGQGPAVLLGDSDGKGATFTNPPFTATLTVANWVATYVTDWYRGNGVTTNSVSSSGTTYTGQVNPGDTPRKVLDFVCDRSGMEWTIDPSFRLSVDTRANLFPTTSAPTAVVRRGEGGRDFAVTGLRGDVSVHSSWEDYTTKVVVKATSGAQGSASLSPATSYYGPGGATVKWVRYIESTKATAAGAADAIASAQLGRFDDARHELKLDTDLYHIDDDVSVGDTLWVFDPPAGLYDTSNQVYYRGRVIFPTSLRVMAMTTPLRRGMGVYLRRSDAGGTVVDLTPFVEWESGSAEVEVGAVRRTLVAS